MAQNAKYYLSLYLIQVILSYNVLTIIQSVQDTGHFFHCTELSIAQSSHIGGWWPPRTESKEGTSLSVTVGKAEESGPPGETHEAAKALEVVTACSTVC